MRTRATRSTCTYLSLFLPVCDVFFLMPASAPSFTCSKRVSRTISKHTTAYNVPVPFSGATSGRQLQVVATRLGSARAVWVAWLQAAAHTTVVLSLLRFSLTSCPGRPRPLQQMQQGTPWARAAAQREVGQQQLLYPSVEMRASKIHLSETA